jgi:hypothetical protein
MLLIAKHIAPTAEAMATHDGVDVQTEAKVGIVACAISLLAAACTVPTPMPVRPKYVINLLINKFPLSLIITNICFII